ncbi:T9SS type A sorting domain-containing protein [Soonwooa sp.]|uniref:T9SS type A sorting domain-containing protein n=1 Tax=Soonwooa sp. TaxID=1938592 RepID=UPI0026304C44|nr:T9SS type A sorting domain-containing protein [Soonwooa sp.]
MKKNLLLVCSFCAVISYAQSTSPSPYCDASFDEPHGPLNDYINSVSFGTLSNLNTGQAAFPRYIFYNNLPTVSFVQGDTYPLNISFNKIGGCGYGVWIDFNQNNIFEASEKVAGTTGFETLGTPSSNIAEITKNIVIPANATLGNTRMRIRIVEDDGYNMNSTDELPCNISTNPQDIMDNGETEDYTINIKASTLDVNTNDAKQSLKIFPNPVSTNLNVEGIEKGSLVRILDMSGKLIYEKRATDTKLNIDTSVYLSGLYLLEYGTEKVKFIVK